ncbi:MAG TPA: methionine adenosyltransferase [Methanoregulaceae archaeon]|nr:methionine adenosyltransferase [Methanoregulaceae archaeon]
MAKIRIVRSHDAPVGKQPVEYVERKGKGHPDSLMDGICERASVELSRYYLDNFGVILHHNLDKGLLVGGAADVGPGFGTITKPIEIIIAGRATGNFQSESIPVDDVVIESAKKYLKENTRFLDVESDVSISTKIRGGSSDLTRLFARGQGVPLANDTSIGVGYAPMTGTEKLTLETEHFLNSAAYKKKMPAVGEDIKIMCLREKKKISINVAVAFVAHLIPGIERYIDYKEKVIADVSEFARNMTDEEIDVSVNTADSTKEGEIYITKSGLSCEAGDDGQAGRGNRANGLNTPFRSMSLEAVAGKNPVSHTGKIYNILSKEIAERTVFGSPGIEDCLVTMVSYVGRNVDDPKSMTAKVVLGKGMGLEAVRQEIKKCAGDVLNETGTISGRIIAGAYTIF